MDCDLSGSSADFKACVILAEEKKREKSEVRSGKKVGKGRGSMEVDERDDER